MFISRKNYDKMEKYAKYLEEENYNLLVANDNLEDVNRLLNERIEILEDRNRDLILENERLKREVKHE